MINTLSTWNTIMSDNKKPQKIVQVFIPYLTILATVYTIFFAKTILLPIVVAAFMALFSNPLVNRLERCRINRSLGSIIVLLIVISILTSIVFLFTNPAQQWFEKLPIVATSMSDSLNEATQSLENNKDLINDADKKNVSDAGKEIRNSTFLAVFKSFASATPIVLTQILATIFLVYFFLVYGKLLLLRVLQARPTFKDKRQDVELIMTIQNELSNYISTITLVNMALGLTVGVVFYFIGIKDAFLWGALAGVLNFAPYIGPLISAFAFALVSYIQFENINHTLIVPAIYLGINMIESQFITPTLLGRTLDLNPLIVFLWLLLWGWLWGGLGMLVGMPLLVCLSIYLERSGLIGEWYLLFKHHSNPQDTP